MRIGRLLREAQRAETRDSAQLAAARVADRAASARAHQECVARFGPFTNDNIRAALIWQEQRIAELLSKAGAR